MLVALIPEGPLHPEDAAAAAVVGLAVGLLLGRRPRTWAIAVVVVAWAVLRGRYGSVVIDGYGAQGSPVLALGATLAALGIAAARPRPVGTTGLMVVGALGGVWAVVPDTEAPLIAGVLLAAALVGSAVTRPDGKASRAAALLVLLPAAAIVAGSAGRPERAVPAALLALLGAFLAAVAVRAVGAAGANASVRPQRAGTPITVVPGSTSSTTTAPAPTTAP